MLSESHRAEIPRAWVKSGLGRETVGTTIRVSEQTGEREQRVRRLPRPTALSGGEAIDGYRNDGRRDKGYS